MCQTLEYYPEHITIKQSESLLIRITYAFFLLREYLLRLVFASYCNKTPVRLLSYQLEDNGICS